MSQEVEMEIQWSDDQSEWTVQARSVDGQPLMPQDIIDGMADYFLMMGWEYRTQQDETPN